MRKPFALGAALFLQSPAFAQTPPVENPTLIGAGVRSRPAYDGSGSQVAELVPVVRYYGKPWFARTTQGMAEAGARVDVSPTFQVGAQLAYEGGRRTSESGFLRDRGVANLDPGASVGLHAEWDGKLGPAPVTLLGRVRRNVHADRGAQADLRLTAGVYARGPLVAGLYTQATWADRRSNRVFYGQPGSDPGGGLLFVGVGALASYELARQWVLIGSVEGRRLQGDAAKSPLSEKKSNVYAAAGLAYRF